MYSSARMRAFIGSATVAVCALGPPVHAQDHKEARAIIDKAINALGGENTQLRDLYRAVFEQILGEGISTNPVVMGADPNR